MDFFKTLASLNVLGAKDSAPAPAPANDFENERLKDKLRELQFELDNPRIPPPSQREMALRDEVPKLEEEVTKLQTLLSRPFAEIARTNAHFRARYEENAVSLADKTIGAAAYKELAEAYARQLGVAPARFEQDSQEARRAVMSGTSKFANDVDQKVVNDLDIKEATRRQKEIDRAKGEESGRLKIEKILARYLPKPADGQEASNTPTPPKA